MKFNFKRVTKKETDQKSSFLVELPPEELELIRGGAKWLTQGHCDSYYNLLAAGQYKQAKQFKKTYYS